MKADSVDVSVKTGIAGSVELLDWPTLEATLSLPTTKPLANAFHVFHFIKKYSRLPAFVLFSFLYKVCFSFYIKYRQVAKKKKDKKIEAGEQKFAEVTSYIEVITCAQHQLTVSGCLTVAVVAM